MSGGAEDLSSLLSLAGRLRRLAGDVLCQGDRALYLMAAEALETRAEFLAAALPQTPCKAQDPQRHQPIDLTI